MELAELIVKVPNLSVKQVPEAEYAMMVLAQKGWHHNSIVKLSADKINWKFTA